MESDEIEREKYQEGSNSEDLKINENWRQLSSENYAEYSSSDILNSSSNCSLPLKESREFGTVRQEDDIFQSECSPVGNYEFTKINQTEETNLTLDILYPSKKHQVICKKKKKVKTNFRKRKKCELKKKTLATTRHSECNKHNSESVMHDTFDNENIKKKEFGTVVESIPSGYEQDLKQKSKYSHYHQFTANNVIDRNLQSHQLGETNLTTEDTYANIASGTLDYLSYFRKTESNNKSDCIMVHPSEIENFETRTEQEIFVDSNFNIPKTQMGLSLDSDSGSESDSKYESLYSYRSITPKLQLPLVKSSDVPDVNNICNSGFTSFEKMSNNSLEQYQVKNIKCERKSLHNNISSCFNTSVSNSTFATITPVSISLDVENCKYPFHYNFNQYKMFDDKINEQKLPTSNLNTKEYLEKEKITGLSTSSLLKNSNDMLNKDTIKKSNDHPPKLKTFNSSDVIMHYRQELGEIAEESMKKILLEREKIYRAMQNGKKSSKIILQNRLNNLELQQNQFDSVVEHAKNQFAYLQSSAYDDVIKACESIKTVVRNESRLFENFFPAYAFRGKVLKDLASNQLLIIKAENCYCFNIVLPLILKKQFPHHFVISCEKSDVQKQCLEHALSMTLKKRNEKCYNQVQFANEFFIMTEQEMLNYSSEKGNFIKKSSCIIFNFPFSRTVTCDILLSNFCDMLVENRNSKLILITSPCMDVTNLQKYFEQLNPMKLSPECLTFPVKSIWKSSSLTPEVNYVEETAKTLMAIHTLEDFGNILVFMPSLRDARSVSKLLRKYCSECQRNDMHDVLLEDNCYALSDIYLFTGISCSQRIVFFSIGSAETLNIPSVCFVVDCGIKEDYIYDGKKNINVLNTVFISSIRVKHRKCLAGGYNPGISYYIYSKLNYIEDMPERDYPEMLYGSPLNTLIKIIKYKPDLATNSQFIESLPKDVADNTFNILQKFGAIVNNTVSKIGEDIIKLPFEAKYSKLILLGIDLGLTYETIIIVSFFTVKGRLFKHSDNPKYQRVIDAMQLNLIKNKSDTLTCINVFKVCVQNNFDCNWCKKYYINFDFVRSIQQKVDEMCEIIYNCLEIEVKKQFSMLDDWCSVLSELLFNCFQENLCVYTGRLECGFRILSSNSIGFLHPLSVAFQEDNVPQFVIFDHLFTVDKNYLKNVTAISSDLIMKALKNSSLNFDRDELFETLINQTIEPVGEEVMNHVFFGDSGEKLDKIIEMIKLKTGSDLISVVPSIKNGCVYIYALPEYMDIAYNALQNIMKVKFEEIINECKQSLFELKKDQNLIFLEVDWSKGAQTTSVKVKPNHQIPNLNEENNGLGNSSFQAKKCARFPYSLHITWLRRPCNGDALVDFTNTTDLRLIRKLSLRHICLQGAKVFMQMSEEKKTRLCISGLPPTTNRKELKRELELLLPDSEIDSIELMHISPFETSEKRLESIKSTIVDICKNFINLDSSEIQIKKPKPKDLYMEIYIKANSCEGLDSVSDILSAKLTEENKIITDIEFTVQVIWDADLCRALQPRLASTLIELQNDLKSQNNLKDWLDSFIDKENDFYTINVHSSNLNVLKLAHKSINSLLDGDVLSSMNVEGINKLFCHGGHVWLRGLEKDENIYILEDHKRKLIRLYGSHVSSERAKVRINKFLEDAENDVMEMIPLSNEKTKNKLLKAVIEKYGINLKSLIEICRMQSALLDIRASMLLLRGNRESIDKAMECIEELFQSLDAVDSSEVLSQEICPVCVCPATNLTFRLEHCGHLYCQPCIQGLIEADNFPIQCIAEGCNKDVVLKDVNKILNDDPERINKLLEKSIRNYIERNVTNIMYCPAPDCNMFFLKNELIENKILCPLCQNNICISCNSIYHDGLTCEFYQGTRRDPDYGFKIWQKNANCKLCPRCKMAIEKSSGCNHMTCKNCSGHFCWLCPSETARIYGTGQEVYTHINQHHPNGLFE